MVREENVKSAMVQNYGVPKVTPIPSGFRLRHVCVFFFAQRTHTHTHARCVCVYVCILIVFYTLRFLSFYPPFVLDT